MKTSPITWAIIRILTRRGKRHVKELRSNCARAGELNRELLMRIVHDNRDTEYGRKYHFDQIHSVEDYKRLVPLSNYDSYAPYIERMTDKEELGTNEIDHGVLFLQQEQTHALWRELRIQKDASLNQVKPVRVLDTPMKKQFFYALREE